MPELTCIARRVGDYESRTEEYELLYAVGEEAAARHLRIKYQAARAYEINAALDAAVEEARAAISEADPNLAQPTDEALRSEEHTSELQSRQYLVCRLLL